MTLDGRECLLVATNERVFISGTSWTTSPALVDVNPEGKQIILGPPPKQVVVSYGEEEQQQLLAGLRAAREAGLDRKRARNRRVKGGLVLGVVLVCVGFLLHFLGGGGGPVDRSPAAVRFCHQSVKAKLTDPASARFENRVMLSDDSVYTVASTVRSKNGFGGVVPSYFVCKAKWEGSRSDFVLWDFSRTG